jgi:putative ABC transport system permease protein
MYELKILFRQRIRFALTVLGVALCGILMLFLLAVYRGVSVGSLEYVRSSDADLWVMQRHAGNILRSTSLLMTATGRRIAEIPGVESAAPVLFIMVSAQTPEGPATLYLTGFEPETGRGGPPQIIEGEPITANDQIILDRSFAAKYRLRTGDQLVINEDTLRVRGLSAGTNMFVIQYAFTSLETAWSVIGFRGIATCFQVHMEQGALSPALADSIRSRIDGVAVYDRKTFLENNVREMESGLLPLLFTVAFISAVVLTAILSLILTISVLERRRDYAIMKAIGSPRWFIPAMVVKQALVLATMGLIVAIVLFLPLVSVVEKLSPEVSAQTSFLHIATVVAGVVLISLVSSIIPNRKLRRIYPLDVFRTSL